MERNGQKPKLIVIAGPTAVGKSGAAVRLAEAIGGEVVSADSMQVYRGMDIGTAKVTQDEMRGIPHHLIDVIDPSEEYNVVRFQQMAKAAIADIILRGKIPILCGGTGFYIQALLYDIDFTKEENAGDEALRDTLLEEAKEEAAQRGDTDGGATYLHAQLTAVDPEAAAAIPKENRKRVLRALEFYRLHGKKISDHNAEQAERKKDAPYDYRFFVLTDDRQKLYERIDYRVDLMIEAGLLNEAEQLRARGIPSNATSMQGIGYREFMRYFNGEYTLEEAVAAIKQNSRHYAKRQLTWFRREENVIWIDIGQTEDVLAEMEKYLWNEDKMHGGKHR